MHSCSVQHNSYWTQYAGLKIDHTESRTCTADFYPNDLVETAAVVWLDEDNYPDAELSSLSLYMCDEFYYGNGPQDWDCRVALGTPEHEFFGWESCSQPEGVCQEAYISVEYYAGDSPDRGLFIVEPEDILANEPIAVLDITFSAEDDAGGGEG